MYYSHVLVCCSICFRLHGGRSVPKLVSKSTKSVIHRHIDENFYLFSFRTTYSY